MKKSFKVLFSLFMFLMVASFTKVEAKDVIININSNGVDTNTIEGVNPPDLGSVDYQRSAYEFEPDMYGGGRLTLLNAGDNYYIHNEFVISGWDGSLTIINGVSANIERLTSTKEVSLYFPNISKLNVDMNRRISISGIKFIKNADIKVKSIDISTDADEVPITNSNFKIQEGSIGFYSSDGSPISDTLIEAPTIYGGYLNPDNVIMRGEEGQISLNETNANELIIDNEGLEVYDVKGFKDSNIKVKSLSSNNYVDAATIDNTLIETQILAYPNSKVTFNKSIIKIGSNNTDLDQDSYVKEIELISSYFEAETDHLGLTSIPFFSTDTDLAQYAAYDEDGNILTPANVNSVYLYNDGDGQTAKHIFIAPLVTITFKVENGTWQNGTTDDIVVTSYQLGHLKRALVPSGMIPGSGYDEGTWDKEIVYDNLDGNYTYTYKFLPCGTEVGDITNTEESNPSTGDKTLIYAIVLFGSTCGIAIARKSKKRLG